MILLGVDTTGESLSAAVTNDGTLLGELYINNGKKHSQTLMCAIDQVLKLTDMTFDGIDAFAVAVGPGSFTGIRIGVAAVSALAYGADKPVYAVNTLDALMCNARETATVCAVMDARRGEVYAAARRCGEWLVEECAVPLIQLVEELEPYPDVIFMGDAASRYRQDILSIKPDSLFASEQFILQHASSVCMCAHHGGASQVGHDALKPHYLRESQAERLREK